MVARAKIKRLREALHDLGRVVCLRDPISVALDANVTPPQLHTILALGRDALSMSELGRRLHCAGPTITGIVDRLEKLRLVERKRDATDRRVIRLSLTAAGRDLHQRFEKALDSHLDMLLGLLAARDQEALVGIFERLSARAVTLDTQKDDSHAS